MINALTIRRANLEDPRDAAAIVDLLDMYSRDAMGGGEGLSDTVRAQLIPALHRQSNGCHFLAEVEGQTVGLALCFIGFSTFYAQPLINVHDLAVRPGYRGRGIGRQLLKAVEQAGQQLSCCKLTLEVREDNARARGLYESLGFEVDPDGSPMYFMVKKLPK